MAVNSMLRLTRSNMPIIGKKRKVKVVVNNSFLFDFLMFS